MSTQERSEEVEAAIAVVRAAGFEVIRVPVCDREGGHGRHSLRTKTFRCEGVEPMPHGLMHLSSRGFLGGSSVICACGRSFTYMPDQDDTPWLLHCLENGIKP